MEVTSTCARGTFEVTNWDEKPFDELDGMPTLTRAAVTETLTGDVEGTGTVEYLMTYREDGSASFVRVERVVGRLGERSGSFVLQGSGTYDNETGTARGTWFVVPGSGTGDLAGLRGEGGFIAQGGEPRGAVTLDYEFE